jgi:hypothetical protein
MTDRLSEKLPDTATPIASVDGWRFWGATDAADGGMVLYSPYDNDLRTAAQRLWPDKVADAVCVFDLHSPPCSCGIYAAADALDAVILGHHYLTFFTRDGHAPTVVLGRVALHSAHSYPNEGTGLVEIRAKRCVIKRLFVPKMWAGERDAKRVARQLADRYRIGVDTYLPACLSEAQLRRGLPALEAHSRALRDDGKLDDLRGPAEMTG